MDQRAQPPTISMLPQLDWRSFGPRGASRIPSFFDHRRLHFVPSGRIAIALALEHLGVKPGMEVLLPAYHCPSMIEPVEWLGAMPVYYRIQPDLSPDLNDLERKITSLTGAALAVHYFGWVTNMKPLHAICKAHDIGLVEDCAHAFFGEHDGTPVGHFGDIAITSLRKFFPLYDGGCVFSATRDLAHLRSTGLGVGYQAKALLDSIEEPVRFGKLPAFRPLIAGVRSLAGRNRQVAGDASDAADGPEERTAEFMDRRYCQASLDGRMSIVSRAMLSLASLARISAKRIENYRFLLQAFGDSRRARPVFPSLPDRTVPYIFALEIDNPDSLHAELKQAGVPMWRWEHLRTDICPVSNTISRSIIQLPCHQELTRNELEFISATANRILR